MIREGDQATSVYLIGTGEVVVEDAAGRVLAKLAAGELIGEVAAATGTRAYRLERTASVRAVGPTTLYEFLRVVHKAPHGRWTGGSPAHPKPDRAATDTPATPPASPARVGAEGLGERCTPVRPVARLG